MLTSVLHLFSKKAIDATGEIPAAPALIPFPTPTSSNLNVSVAWVAIGYVNSTPCRWCYYYPSLNAMIHGFLIHQTSPHANCICPARKEDSHLNRFRIIYRGETTPHPVVLIFFFFFFHSGDNRTMTWLRLVMHHCPRSICLFQVHHLTLNVCSRIGLHSPVVPRQHLSALGIVGPSHPCKSTRQEFNV